MSDVECLRRSASRLVLWNVTTCSLLLHLKMASIMPVENSTESLFPCIVLQIKYGITVVPELLFPVKVSRVALNITKTYGEVKL